MAALTKIVQNNEKLTQARHEGDLLKYRDQLFSTLHVLAVNQSDKSQEFRRGLQEKVKGAERAFLAKVTAPARSCHIEI